MGAQDPKQLADPIVLEIQRAPRIDALELIQGASRRRLLLKNGHHVLGTAADADLRLEVANLSERHAAFRQRDGERVCHAVDGDVYLNGLKVHSAVLRQGDVLQLGDALFVYLERG